MPPAGRAHAAEVLVDGHGADLRVRTNLGSVDACLHPSIFGALAAHLGLEAEPMMLAVTPRGDDRPDPRYPAITTLIRKARRDWDRFGAQLVEQVGKLLNAGKLLPLTAVNEALLLELFRDHEVAIVARFAGRSADLPRYQRLVQQGLIEEPTRSPATIDLAYRLGRGLDMLHAHRVGNPEAPTLEHVVREALAVKLDDRDRVALEYVRRRGEIYMRRPADQCTSDVHRALNEVEIGAFRTATEQALRGRKGPKELAAGLRAAAAAVALHPEADREAVRRGGAHAVPELVAEAMAARTLQNDMQRVARTEIAFAQSAGALEALKAQCAGIGVADPWVYKFVSPFACTDCKRIWGHPKQPRRYRLSEVEAREAAGGNFRLPHNEWGPVVGPVHPNCTEGPLQFWEEKLVASINRAADEILAVYRTR